MKRFSDLSDPVQISAADAQSLKDAIGTLTELVTNEHHVPSMDLLGRCLIAGYIRFHAVNGFDGKYGLEYRAALNKRGLTERQFLAILDSQAQMGLALLADASKSGFAPSQLTLSQLQGPMLGQKAYTHRSPNIGGSIQKAGPYLLGSEI